MPSSKSDLVETLEPIFRAGDHQPVAAPGETLVVLHQARRCSNSTTPSTPPPALSILPSAVFLTRGPSAICLSASSRRSRSTSIGHTKQTKRAAGGRQSSTSLPVPKKKRLYPKRSLRRARWNAASALRPAASCASTSFDRPRRRASDWTTAPGPLLVSESSWTDYRPTRKAPAAA